MLGLRLGMCVHVVTHVVLMWQFSKFLHLEVEEARCEVYDNRYLGKRKEGRIACDIKSLFSLPTEVDV